MKKHNLLKVLGITFLVVLIMTWIIPAGYYSSGEFVDAGTAPLGFFDLARTPLIAIANLIQYGILFALIGGFYGVLAKTDVYLPMIDKISAKLKGKETRFLAIMTVVFTVVSAVTGLDLFLLVLVPFVASIIIGIGCDKMSAMLATIGSIIIGKIGSVYSTSVTFYSSQYLGLENTSDIWPRVVICLVVTALYALFVVGRNKKKSAIAEVATKSDKMVEKEVKTEKVVTKQAPKKANVVKTETKTTSTKKTDAKKTSSKKTTSKKTTTKKASTKKSTKACAKAVDQIVVKNTKKRSFLPLIISLVIIAIVIVLAMYDWATAFNTTFFNDLYSDIMGVEVNGYPLVANIIGSVTSFGNWGIYDLIIFLLLITPIIGWIYGVKLDDMIDGFVEGIKKALPAACYAVLANVIYAAMYSTSTGANIMFTIANWLIGLTEDFSVITATLLSGIGSFFFNDFQTLIGSLSTPIATNFTDATVYPFIAIIFQSIYGLVMMIAPTSVLLVGGLGLFDISFGEWIKGIWKFLLKLLIVIVILFIVIAMFI
ncbi:MAG: SLC13 family permease [Bacilli bacterium]